MRCLVLALGAAAVLAPGCDWYFGEHHEPGSPDAGIIVPPPDADGVPDTVGDCLTATQRTHECTYDLSGTIVDFSTLAAPDLPGVQLDVLVTTAWDTIPFFLPFCPALL